MHKSREALIILTIFPGAGLDGFFCKTGEVDHSGLVVCIDIKQLDSRAKVIHELAQRPRGHGPVVTGFSRVKFGMHSSFWLKW